jgi:hypothetical protein
MCNHYVKYCIIIILLAKSFIQCLSLSNTHWLVVYTCHIHLTQTVELGLINFRHSDLNGPCVCVWSNIDPVPVPSSSPFFEPPCMCVCRHHGPCLIYSVVTVHCIKLVPCTCTRGMEFDLVLATPGCWVAQQNPWVTKQAWPWCTYCTCNSIVGHFAQYLFRFHVQRVK